MQLSITAFWKGRNIMARPRKYDSQRIIELTEDYFVNTANGDPSMLKFSLIEQFLNDNGMNVKAYNLRRDEELVRKIDELRDSDQIRLDSIKGAAYKNLDIDGLIRKSYDLNALRKALSELDAYWKSVYEKADAVAAENRKLISERSRLIKENKELSESMLVMEKTIRDQDADTKLMKRENNYLRGMIKKYIYPAVANVMLGRMNLPQNEDAGAVDIDAVSELIDDGKPSPFNGIQKKHVRKLSREEELIAKMKRMVES
jgi:hypothetical protein